MFIQTNINAMQALRYTQMNNKNLNKIMEQLSTGLRINRAADDVAGLAISESMRFQINGSKQAIRNISDGLSLIQTTEGILNSVQIMLQRMAVLANQAVNGTYSDKDRELMDIEFKQLREEIDSISKNSKFNGIKLFDGKYSFTNSDGLRIQAGYEADDEIRIDMPNLDKLKDTLKDLKLDSSTDANVTLSKMSSLIDDVSKSRATLGAYQNRLEYRTNYLYNTIENLTASMSRIVDTDYAQAMTDFVKANIMLNASTAMLAQANSLPHMLLKLLDR